MGDFDVLVNKYQNMKKESADIEDILEILDEISKISYDERLMFEWALWYWKAEYPARAKRVCKKMNMYFHGGEWVEKTKAVLEMLDNDEEFPEEMESYLTVAETKKKEPEVPVIIQEAFEGMVGMESVKKELVSFYNMARIEKMRETELGITANDSRAYNFVLYGNPGTGKTTVARVIAKVLYALGIRENDNFMEVDRSKLVSEYIGQTAVQVRKAVEDIRGGTLFIDEAYTLYKKGDEKDFGQEAINTLLKDMEDHRTEYSVIMAGYKNQMTEMLNHANPGFRSRFTYHITIPDYSDEELLQIAENVAKSQNYKIDKQAYDEIKKCIDRERIDETFGNARFIRTLMEKAQMNLANRLSLMESFTKEDLRLLRAEDFAEEADEDKDLPKLLEELHQLTGLHDVKITVQALVDRLEAQKEREKMGLKVNAGIGSLHMSFRGNAGTGKTTIARLLGKILGKMGVLKRGDVFVEAKREDLVGQYQGHTAAKVKDVIRSAMGGVLFIDEAYSLVNGDNDTYGKEAINALVAEMENNRDSLIVILAGYTSDIDRLLSENQGLRSRVTRDLFFEDYTIDELAEIFYFQIKKIGFKLSEDLKPAVIAKIEKEMEKTADFGNARGVRNIVEAVLTKQDIRLMRTKRAGEELTKQDMITIIEEDLQ